MSNGPWTDEENDLIVADYFAMLADDISARRYSKAEHRRALLPLLADSDPRRVTKTGSAQSNDPATDPAADGPDTDNPAADADNDPAQADQQD